MLDSNFVEDIWRDELIDESLQRPGFEQTRSEHSERTIDRDEVLSDAAGIKMHQCVVVGGAEKRVWRDQCTRADAGYDIKVWACFRGSPAREDADTESASGAPAGNHQDVLLIGLRCKCPVAMLREGFVAGRKPLGADLAITDNERIIGLLRIGSALQRLGASRQDHCNEKEKRDCAD